MKNILPDNQIEIFIKKLNSCYSPYRQWTLKKARKIHTDMFGAKIEMGVYYYRISVDGFLENDLKLSEPNMARFLYMVFAPCPSWEADSEKTIQKNLEEAREIINKLMP